MLADWLWAAADSAAAAASGGSLATSCVLVTTCAVTWVVVVMGGLKHWRRKVLGMGTCHLPVTSTVRSDDSNMALPGGRMWKRCFGIMAPVGPDAGGSGIPFTG